MFATDRRWLAGLALATASLALAQDHPVSGTVSTGDGSVTPVGWLPTVGYHPSGGGLSAYSPVYNVNVVMYAPPYTSYMHFVVPAALTGFVWRGEWGTLLLSTGPGTAVPLVANPVYSISVGFYVIATDTFTCPGQASPCTSFALRFHALYGSLGGTVTHADGTPVGAGITVAAYPAATPAELQRFTVTDAQGHYTFTLTDGAVLLNSNHVLSPSLPPALQGYVALEPGNNWGLRLDPDVASPGTSPASRDYIVVAGFDEQGNPLPASAPNAVRADVHSSQLTERNLLATGLCKLPPLSPITDPLAQQFEAQNGNVVDIGHLTSAMQAALNCFQAAVATAGGTITVVSAFRPPAYQAHLREVWVLWDQSLQLTSTERADCASMLAQLQTEWTRHGIVFLPAANSAHTQGEAFDAVVNAQGGPSAIDTLAASCGLRRPVPVGDPNHFTR